MEGLSLFAAHMATDFDPSVNSNVRQVTHAPTGFESLRVRTIRERGNQPMKLVKKVLITIGREYGSGGRAISKMLGEDLDIPVYDKNIISIIAKKHGYDEQALVKSDEKLSNPFFEPYSPYGTDTGALSEKLFILQAQIIKEEAEKGPAIFLGRCANDILRNRDDLFNIFIFSPREARIRHIMEVDNVPTEEQARKIIKKEDKTRRSFYQFYTDKRWGSPEGMDLLINSDSLGYDGSVRLIEEYLKLKGYAE